MKTIEAAVNAFHGITASIVLMRCYTGEKNTN